MKWLRNALRFRFVFNLFDQMFPYDPYNQPLQPLKENLLYYKIMGEIFKPIAERFFSFIGSERKEYKTQYEKDISSALLGFEIISTRYITSWWRQKPQKLASTTVLQSWGAKWTTIKRASWLQDAKRNKIEAKNKELPKLNFIIKCS